MGTDFGYCGRAANGPPFSRPRGGSGRTKPPDPRLCPFVKNIPHLHLAFTFDIYCAVRFTDEVILNKFVGGVRDLNAAAHAMRLHTAGPVHGAAPQVLD